MKIKAPSAVRILDAVSFLNSQYGITLNGMVTLSFTQLGLVTASESNRALTKLNEALAGRLRRVQANMPEQYRLPHTFVYAHEYVGSHGHHVHQLLALPDGTQAGLDDWLRSWARRGFGENVNPLAVNFRGQFYRDQDKALAQQTRLVRYILKSSDDAGVARADGSMTTLHGLLGVQNPNYAYTAPVRKPVGCSQNLTKYAQWDVGFEPPNFIEDCLTDHGLKSFRRRKDREELIRMLKSIDI